MRATARNVFASTALVLLTCCVGTAHGERAPEDKGTADYVLTGKVLKVFKRQEGRRHDYVVLIAVREVHKGERLKKGDAFYACCFQMTKIPFPIAEPGGHDGVPKEGQIIKAYVRDRGGLHEGNYSDWFDLVEDQEAKKDASHEQK